MLGQGAMQWQRHGSDGTDEYSSHNLERFSQNPSVGINVDSRNQKQNSPPKEWSRQHTKVSFKHFMGLLNTFSFKFQFKLDSKLC